MRAVALVECSCESLKTSFAVVIVPMQILLIAVAEILSAAVAELLTMSNRSYWCILTFGWACICA